MPADSPQPSYEQLLVLNADLYARLERALGRIAELEADLGTAKTRIADLQAQLKQSSKNSSKPPSADGLAKPAPKSLRGRSGRGPGRPAGQPGTTLEQIADPDVIVRHTPSVCAGCDNDLAGAAEVAVTRRQVFDIPEPTVVVTEHQIVTLACPCGHHTTGDVPAGVTAPAVYGPRIAAIGVYLLHGQFLSIGRTADALRDLFGLPVAPATVTAWVKRTALGIIDRVLPVIRDRIRQAPVVHFDETGLRVEGRLAWLHSASTDTDVLLTAHPKRGTAAMDDAGVLPGFTGIAMHDAWAPYDTYTTATHALCNAHVLRELVYVTDTATGLVPDLATQAITALRRLNHLTSDAHTADLADLQQQQHVLRSAVVLGAEATAERDGTLQRKHHALFVRLRDRRDDYLRFITDPAVPFDNNAAEQTIRMPKLRIKVSGSLRTMTGAEHFAAIRSYTTTATHQGINMLDALIQAVTGKPWIPTTT